MNIYVINPYQETEPHFRIIGMIPAYHSLLWNPQLYGLGYFEMKVEATKENAALLQEGRMLVRESDIIEGGENDDEYRDAMIIRRVSIIYDADQGYTMTVSGKSIKDILSQRIIWEKFECTSASIGWVIQNLIQRNASQPTNYADNKKRMANIQLTDAQNAKNAAQLQYDDAKDAYDNAKVDYNRAATDYSDAMAAYQEAVDQYGSDSPEAKVAKDTMDMYRVTMDMAKETMDQMEAVMNDKKATLDEKVADLDAAQSKYDYYVWFDTVSAKRGIPYLTTDVSDPPASVEVTLSLLGENLGEWCETIAEEYGLGWGISLFENTMLFYFVLGTDRHTTVEFSPELDNLKNAEYARDLSIYRNAGLATGEGEGYLQVSVDIGNSSGASRYEEYIATGLIKDEETSDATYKEQVKQAGKSEITKLKKHETITGEIDTDGVYKIGEDFDMGDVVTVKLQQGITATTRLTEILYSDEADGTKTMGTFEEWEV